MEAHLNIRAHIMEPPNVSTFSSVSQRSLRPRMGDSRPTHPTRQARRASQEVADAEDPQRRLLRLEKWLSVASTSPRFPSVVDCTRLYITILGCGAWTVPGSASTRCCAKGSAYAEVAIPNRVRGSSTPNR